MNTTRYQSTGVGKVLRDIVFERDSYTCILCERAAVDCHHVVKRSQGGRDNPHNLVSLCRIHHDIAHGVQYPTECNFLSTPEAQQAIVEYIQDYYAAEIERGIKRVGW